LRGLIDIKLEAWVKKAEFVGLEFYFFTDPMELSGQIEGVNVEEFIPFPADFLFEIVFILDSKDQIRDFHGPALLL
jgi:hypothetical protein